MLPWIGAKRVIYDSERKGINLTSDFQVIVPDETVSSMIRMVSALPERISVPERKVVRRVWKPAARVMLKVAVPVASLIVVGECWVTVPEASSMLMESVASGAVWSEFQLYTICMVPVPTASSMVMSTEFRAGGHIGVDRTSYERFAAACRQ